ncbi:DUF397 domain-containing protein [Actinomadura sp. 21ATH]|uniref:DUF397 domain-containing protein n=1 Tax=Actinomadura sp. 21ATH TaxID=1735444 RepID=UPI0035C00827
MNKITWRKSSRSGTTENSACVELAALSVVSVGIRDSKAPDAGHIVVACRGLPA